MKLFDLHCDTITVLEERGGSLFSNDLHVSLERAEGYEALTQVFAIFIPDTLRGQQAASYFGRVCEFYNRQIEENIRLISPFIDKSQTQMKAILAVEGGAAANGSLEGLQHLFDCGVRIMTLTWNGQNEIASGCFAQEDSGLTNFGREVVAEMEKVGMIVDVSHLSKRSFWGVAENSKKPFIASHSNCDIAKNTVSKRRNLDKNQILCLIEKGGLMGLNLSANFLGDDGDSSFEAVYRHVSYALDLGAENILSLGCDFDGCSLLPEFAGIEKLKDIYEYLLSKNIGEELCDKIFYENANKFFACIV